MAVGQQPAQLFAHGAVENRNHEPGRRPKVRDGKGVPQRDHVIVGEYRDGDGARGKNLFEVVVVGRCQMAHLVAPVRDRRAHLPRHIGLPDDDESLDIHERILFGHGGGVQGHFGAVQSKAVRTTACTSSASARWVAAGMPSTLLSITPATELIKPRSVPRRSNAASCSAVCTRR